MFGGNMRPRTIKHNSELSAAISVCSLYFSYYNYYLFCTYLFVRHFIVINEKMIHSDVYDGTYSLYFIPGSLLDTVLILLSCFDFFILFYFNLI